MCFNLAYCWRVVPKRCGAVYAGAGILGAFAGSTASKAFDGQKLLFLFAIIMVVVGVMMLRGRKPAGVEGAQCTRENAPKVLGYGGCRARARSQQFLHA